MQRIIIPDDIPLFFTSDMHFNHFNIARFCNRPFLSNAEMTYNLIKNFNEVVPENGITIHCGDFCFDKDANRWKKIINQLNGELILISGNHDFFPKDKQKSDIILIDLLKVAHKDKEVMCSHYPLTIFNGDYNAYGHVHTLSDGKIHGKDSVYTRFLNPSKQYDVGVDQNNYKPISFDNFISKFE